MNLFIISDLHITGPEDSLYSSLLALFRARAQAGDEVVLLGDLFDLFVGDKRFFKQRYSEFFEVLHFAGSQGVKIHYVEGNHDFMLGHTFESVKGMKVYSHEVILEFEGRRFFLAHGDTVDRKDYFYHALRMFFRSFFMKVFILAMPGNWLDQIGKKSSQLSRKKSAGQYSHLPLEKREYLRKVYRNFAVERLAQGYDYVVLGHCHDLDEMTFNIGDRVGQYINVGFPRVHGSFLSWAPNDPKVRREKLPEKN